MENEKLLDIIVKAALDLKAIDPHIIDLEKESSLTDYIFICHGTSSVHIKGIVDNIDKELKKHKTLPMGTEGKTESQWILMDYNSVLVHVFTKEIRDYYDIEGLYSRFKTKPIEIENG